MMGERRERPGVMLYFDALRPAISRMDDAQCGALLRAILDYAQFGETPELDALTGMAFDMLVPKIDRDSERYKEGREQRQYAAYVREKKKTGEPCLSITEWRLFQKPPKSDGPLSADHGSDGPLSADHGSNGPYPSITASATATASPSASPSAATSASASTTTTASSSAAAAGKGFKGEGARLKPLPTYPRFT